ncbi:MAG: SAF domain-containing protein [Chloroflexota bacterium]
MKKSLSLLILFLLLLFIVPAESVFAADGPEFIAQDGEEEGDEENNEFKEVVVAQVAIPLGTRLEAEFLTTELRPVSNMAVRGNFFFGAVEEVVGSIVQTDIAKGQEILAPMVAIDAVDLSDIGSDLALHVDNGRVSVAFPIDALSAASFAMRPGDFVDVLMSFDLIQLDLEFQTPLPNIARLVDEDSLENGESFLFPAVSQGRLELIPEIDRVVEVVPQGVTLDSQEASIAQQIPRRTSQLTIQQAEVLWLGNWANPNQAGWEGPNNYDLRIQLEELRRLEQELDQLSPEEQESLLLNYGLQAQTLRDQLEIARSRLEQLTPDIVLLSLPLQDALTMKWALEEPGIDIDLVLRSQGDQAVFVTTAVSLPQLVEQAGLAVPEPIEFGLEPNIEEFDGP